MPDPPNESADFSGYTAANGDLLLGYEGWIFNYPDQEWISPPTPPGGYPYGATVIMTDSQLITWGGVIWEESDGQILNTGWQYDLSD